MAWRCLISPAQLSEVNRARQELVFRKNEPKEVRAKTTSREGADEDVGVEEHPHDTSSNTGHLAFFCHSRSTVNGPPPVAAKNRKTKQYKTANSPRLSNGQKPCEA